MPHKAFFLDRDGVLNKNIYYSDTGEWESPRTPQELVLIDGVVEALHALQDAGYTLFIVTNQPSYAKGKTSLEALKDTLACCVEQLQAKGVYIRHAYVSYHHPKSVIPELAVPCPYRKPSPQALLDAARDYAIDLQHSWMIGDRDTDSACGERAGVKTIRICPDYEQEIPSHPTATLNARNLSEAVATVLQQEHR